MFNWLLGKNNETKNSNKAEDDQDMDPAFKAQLEDQAHEEELWSQGFQIIQENQNFVKFNELIQQTKDKDLDQQIEKFNQCRMNPNRIEEILKCYVRQTERTKKGLKPQYRACKRQYDNAFTECWTQIVIPHVDQFYQKALEAIEDKFNVKWKQTENKDKEQHPDENEDKKNIMQLVQKQKDQKKNEN